MSDITPKSNELRLENLPPILREFAKSCIEINRQGREFCVKDFPNLDQNTFRQRKKTLQRLGWIITTSRGTLAWYRIKGEYTGKENRKLTGEGMGVGSNMQNIINEASVQMPEMHDIKIKFPSIELHQSAIKRGAKPHPQNKGIRLKEIELARGIRGILTIYPSAIMVEISCTKNPIIYDIRGAQEFITHLESIKVYLTSEFDVADIPDCLDWIAVHYHINQDGQTEFSDPTFRRTISDITGGFIRMYAKRSDDGKNHLRMERIIKPNCSIAKLISDMTGLANYLHSDSDNLSNVMPSQILGLNRFAEIVARMSMMCNMTCQGVYSF